MCTIRSIANFIGIEYDAIIDKLSEYPSRNYRRYLLRKMVYNIAKGKQIKIPETGNYEVNFIVEGQNNIYAKGVIKSRNGIVIDFRLVSRWSATEKFVPRNILAVQNNQFRDALFALIMGRTFVWNKDHYSFQIEDVQKARSS